MGRASESNGFRGWREAPQASRRPFSYHRWELDQHEARVLIGRYAGVLFWVLAVVLGSPSVAAELELVAKVNGASITRSRLEATFKTFLAEQGLSVAKIKGEAHYRELVGHVLELLIGQELFWQEAKRRGLTATPAQVDQAYRRARSRYRSDEAFLHALKQDAFSEESYREHLQHELSVRRLVNETIAKHISVSAEEIHEHYVANPERYRRPVQISARHILIKVDPDADDAAVAVARRKIEQILAEAKQGADFAALARQYSQGPSGPNGGRLGFLPRGRLAKEFEDVAFQLKPGEISDVVRTHYGFHIIKLDARRGGYILPERDAARAIRNDLIQQKLRDAVQQRIDTLRKQASVEIFLPVQTNVRKAPSSKRTASNGST